MPPDDLVGSEAAEAINSSEATVLGPDGPSVMVVGARREEEKGLVGGVKLQGPP